jgi:uncharacterized protein
MKRRLAIIITIIICFAAAMPAYADDAKYVFDEIEKIGSSSESKLNEKANDIYKETGIIVSYLLVGDLQEDSIDYAEGFYKETFGKEEGILLIETDSEWYIHLQGELAGEFDKADREAMWEGCGNAEYYNEGAEAFIDKAAELIEQKGISYVTSEKELQESHHDRVVDKADLLTPDEESELEQKLNEISAEQKCDVAIVAVDSLGGKTAQAYADDYYDYEGYGMGSNDDGIMFVISMDERKWAITTHAFGITAFTDAGQQYIMEQVSPYLSEGDYAEAFNEFADQCDMFIEQAQTGDPYDVDNMPDGLTTFHYIIWLLPSFFGGAIVSIFLKKRKRKSLKNVRFRPDAEEYLQDMRLTTEYDRFINRRFAVIKIEKDDDGPGGGGSSIHTSSSGRTHGGSSGSF